MQIQVLVTTILAIILGLMIVKIVDQRLSGISINMPTVNLPEITVNLKSDHMGSFTGTSYMGRATPKVKVVQPNSSIPMFNELRTLSQHGGGNTTEINVVCKKDLPPARNYDERKYYSNNYALTKEQREKVTGPAPNPNKDHQGRPAPYPRITPELERDHPLATNNGKDGHYYLKPEQMTPAQLVKFMEKAKFHNMTVQDYQNWLRLFMDHPEQLAAFHRSNLRVIVRGGQLTPEDMPKSQRLPNRSEHEYIQKITQGPMENVPQPEYLGYQPYNFEDAYPGAKVRNRNLRHLDYVNRDEPYKTWILTREGKLTETKMKVKQI